MKDEIAQIDADRCIVKTSSPVLAYDYLVVALGAEPMPTLIPGFSEVGFNLYAREEIGRLRDSVTHLEGREDCDTHRSPLQMSPCTLRGGDHHR